MGSVYRLGIALALALIAGLSHGATVEFFSPQGTVKGVRQVTARFSEQMVPFGDPRLTEPFDVQCAEKGAGRWIDGKNWSYDFNQDLPAGIRCTFKLKPAAKSLKGNALTGEREFAFSTGGPAILHSEPREGSTIEEDQVFLLGLDAPATEATIQQHVYCDIEGVAEKVNVRILKGEERKALLEQSRYFLNDYFYALFKHYDDLWALKVPAKGSKRERFLRSLESDQSPVVALQCQRRLPNDKQVRLVWGAQVTTASGIANEADQALAFATRREFVATLNCDRVNAKSDCIPILPVYLNFSAPVSINDVKNMRIKDSEGKTYAAEVKPPEGEPQDWMNSVRFPGPLPERASFVLEIPANLKDDSGRALVNQNRFPLNFKTDEFPPLAKFAARFGIIEAKDPVLPITLRNLEDKLPGKVLQLPNAGAPQKSVPGQVYRVPGNVKDMLFWLARVRRFEYEQDKVRVGERSIFKADAQTKKLEIPKPGGGKEFEVVGIPLGGTGFFVVEAASSKLGAALHGHRQPYYVQSAALVTNLSAHLKWGVESSLVWVTTLDNAAPVPNANVTVTDCHGTVHWRGTSDTQGIAAINTALPLRDSLPHCNDLGGGLFAFVSQGSDLTLVHSDWNEGISTWRFNVGTDFSFHPSVDTTIFARTLLRAGETVQMKHLHRLRNQTGFDFDPDLAKQGKLRITHAGTNQNFEFDLTWDKQGIAESTWRIPEDAKQGEYLVFVNDRMSGSFRVESFRVPTMRGVIKPPEKPLVNAAQATIDVQLNYLAGGGVADAPVRVNSILEHKYVTFPDYDGFTFANGNIKEGRTSQNDAELRIGAYLAGEPDSDMPNPNPDAAKPLGTVNFNLDRFGAGRTVIDKLPKVEVPRDILTEFEYHDANGEISTVAARIPLWPSNIVVGLKPDGWAASKDKLKFHVLALDLKGKPAANVAVKVDMLQRQTLSHRKRLVGGFYAYENSVEVKLVGAACEGRSNDKGLLICDIKSPVSGNVILRAQAKDGEGNASYANTDIWVAGKDEWWFEQSNDDRMDLLPEKKRYEPNETARLQVRMPFREATALVTVEREGVLKSFVTKLSGKSPTVDVPLAGHYAPNVFISVLAVRGRVGDVQPTALVDLGKPAFKMGLSEIKVGWLAHELKVNVAADKQVYTVREQSDISVQVRRADGKPLPAGTEIALAAVDEGLLELMPNTSWNLLENMMRERGLGVDSATAQMQVVGRRHYGRKALAAGGGGGLAAGNATARELFDTLLFWKGRIVLDAKGEARVKIPLNDSLTSFRFVAIANGAHDLFGTGHVSVRSSQDLMLFSGLPSVSREEDFFRGGFTVRNASDKKLDVELSGTVVAGRGTQRGIPVVLQPRTVSLEPGVAQELGWSVTTPVNADALYWEVSAKASGGTKPVTDRIKISQKVLPAVKVRVIQATIAQLEKPIAMQVALPADAIPGRGGVKIDLSRSLAGQLDGVREYMGRYPYTCLEQRVSKSIALRDEKMWRAIADSLPVYLDSDGLARYFPGMFEGSDALTAYVLSIAYEAGWAIPPESEARMRAALTGFVQGRVLRYSSLPTADVAIRKIAALEALSRGAQPIPPALLESIAIEPNLWPTSAVLDWYNVLQRTPTLPDRDKRLANAEQIIRSRLNFQGTMMGFSTERNDYLWWLMISGDVNANRMLLTVLDQASWKEDMPRLARGTTLRQKNGHWNTTVANAWGTLALEKFAQKFEAIPVVGSTQAALASATEKHVWNTGVDDATLKLPWPKAADSLAMAHDGKGKPWVTVTSMAAIPLKQPLSTGFKVQRTVTPVDVKVAGQNTRGDVLRVRLDLEAQSDMTWVVVNDPIPAGATILGTGLGRDSQILTQGEKRQGWVWPAFEERTFDSFRSYYDYVPKGKWTVEYTMRLNNSGQFHLPETRVEAMYVPEMFGETPNATLVIAQPSEPSFGERAKRWIDSIFK